MAIRRLSGFTARPKLISLATRIRTNSLVKDLASADRLPLRDLDYVAAGDRTSFPQLNLG